MKKIAIIAAIAAFTAVPAAAQSNSAAFAIAHTNLSADNASEAVNYTRNSSADRVANRGRLASTFSTINSTADTASERVGVRGATAVAGSTPSHAQEVFARLRAESLENE